MDLPTARRSYAFYYKYTTNLTAQCGEREASGDVQRGEREASGDIQS